MDAKEPEWDESPVTLAMVRELLDAHPEYRVTKHQTANGHQFTLIQHPNDEGEYLEDSSGEFISWVSDLIGRMEDDA